MAQEHVPRSERDDDDRSVSEIRDIINYHQEQVAYWESRFMEKKRAEQSENQTVIKLSRIIEHVLPTTMLMRQSRDKEEPRI